MARLPPQAPPRPGAYRAWATFEFVAEDGGIYKVDLVVLAPGGFLVEIKSHHGILQGDAHSWRWTDGARESIIDPLILANQKARKLASLLKQHPALSRMRAPYLTPIGFCSTPGVKIKLTGAAALNVYERDRGTEERRERGILARLTALQPAKALAEYYVGMKHHPGPRRASNRCSPACWSCSPG